MSIALFAIIGAKINAGAAYWICFGIFCVFKATNAIISALKEVTD